MAAHLARPPMEQFQAQEAEINQLRQQLQRLESRIVALEQRQRAAPPPWVGRLRQWALRMYTRLRGQFHARF